MGAITNYNQALANAAQEADQALVPKKKKSVVPVPVPAPVPRAIPSQEEMTKAIAGFKKKGWIK
jgi:hypothetical protein